MKSEPLLPSKNYDIITLFKAGNGRMAIHGMIAKQACYYNLIQGRKRPNGHTWHDCEASMLL